MDIIEIKSNLAKINISVLTNQLEDLNTKISNSSFDPASDAYINILKEQTKVTNIIEIFNNLTNKIKLWEETQILLEDPDYGEIAKEDASKLTEEIKTIYKEFDKLTVTPLLNDEKKAIFEIRPGVGGTEASLFAETLYRMYIRYCNTQKLRVELYTVEYDNEGGIKEATFLVDSPGSFGHLRFESGVHRVQRVPTTEAAGRIHTSTASVVIMPEFTSRDIEIKPEEIRVDFYRSSGPGGQSVNTTDSAVRITHIPTKIVVTCQAGKSQHKNKETALTILQSKLQQIETEKKASEENKIREQAISGGDRSAKIRTYNFPQGRVTDHRIHQSWFNIYQIVEGEISDVIDTVNTELRKKLQN